MPPRIVSRTLPLLTVDGLAFKDLNRSGRLEPYKDWRLPPAERARDLLSRMTLAEKAGTMVHANPPAVGSAALPGAGLAWDMPGIQDLLVRRHITTFLNRLSASASALAQQHNDLQAMAEQGRLGLPVSLSTDPRNQFASSQGVSVTAADFTQWPDPPGLAATGDAALVRAHADLVRQEYLAVGIRIALSPMADLAVNPRWHRCSGTFGSQPQQVAALVQAYVEGMQHGPDGITASSVVAVVKHWVGYGATAPDGYDAHNHYGRHMALDSGDIEAHIQAFTGAFAARVGGVMPAYNVPPEQLHVQGCAGPVERVAPGFNRQLLQGVLRGRFAFDGVVLSDWHITDDCSDVCKFGAPPGQQPGPSDIAMPWGVEHLTRPERFAKAIEAGVDQFGGVNDPEVIVGLVQSGRLAEAALDAAVGRILLQKFQQGLFENPYVDVDAAAAILERDSSKQLALQAQRRSVVLVRNCAATLPLNIRRTPRLYLFQIDADAVRRRGFVVVDRLEDADLALAAVSTPHEVLHPGHFFGSRYREGSTGFRDGDAVFETLRLLSARVPLVLAVDTDRPADLSRVAPLAAAILVTFGLGIEALLDVLLGLHSPKARLPYDLPWAGEGGPPPDMAVRLGQGLGY